METKLTLKEKNSITLSLQQVKLELETIYRKKFDGDNPKPLMLQALNATKLAKDEIALTYAKNEVEKMFA